MAAVPALYVLLLRARYRWRFVARVALVVRRALHARLRRDACGGRALVAQPALGRGAVALPGVLASLRGMTLQADLCTYF